MDRRSTEKDEGDMVTLAEGLRDSASSQQLTRHTRLKMQKQEKGIYLSPYVASVDWSDSGQFSNLRRKVFGVQQLVGVGGDHVAVAICDWKEFEESCIKPGSSNQLPSFNWGEMLDT